MSEYRQARLLKYNRVCKKITQENLSEGICDPVTLARYEAGRLEPSNENYYRLMSKMGLNGDRYYISSGNESYEKYELKNKIKKSLECQDNKEIRKLIAIYELGANSIEDIQYVKRINAAVKYHDEEISIEEYENELTEALLLTDIDIRDKNWKFIKIYSEEEILILSSLIMVFWLQNKKDIALKICEFLEVHYKQEWIVKDLKDYTVFLVTYSNILGQETEHEKSIEVCRAGIELLKRNHKANYLYNFYFNIGWNLNEMSKLPYKKDGTLDELDYINLQENRKTKAKKYVRMSYCLCLLFPESERSLKYIEQYLKAEF